MAWTLMTRINRLSGTASLCPECLERIPAARIQRGETVYLEKTCADHGSFSVPVWRGMPDMARWQRPKIPIQPPHCRREVNKGCPFDCGLCPDHRQRSCTIILEVTHRCNLACPVCYADSPNRAGKDPSLDVIREWFEEARLAGTGSNIQLSGGEPTVRDDLPAMVDMGRRAGFEFIQINTNGVRLGRDPGFAARLKAAGLASVFLQFDGTRDDVYRQLRGRSLLAEKQAAIKACADQGLGVVLVPTLVPAVNDGEVGAILGFAVDHAPVVRAVHFQPVSYFGRFLHSPEEGGRITLPELIQAIEHQSGGRFPADVFAPPGCENSLCSFSASFLVMPDLRVRPVGGKGAERCCATPIPAGEGAANAMAFVARQWAAPDSGSAPAGALSPWRGAPGEGDGPPSLDSFLERARTHLLSVSAMAFQDVWNLDLERVRDCCIHVMAPDGRLVPFCLYNLTSRSGESLYRP
jgi:uncharacterized radical SAM superfamily Fe-S cluster-containing enzyme